MPHTHSELYLDRGVGMVTEVDGKPSLNAVNIATWLSRDLPTAPVTAAAAGNNIYDQLSDLLREVNDAQFGIVSKLVDGPGGEKQWVRDATGSTLPLESRISHDSPVIEANNALLRCLSRLRAIDYAIAKKYPGGEGDGIRAAMKTKLAELTTQLLTIAQGTADDKEKLKQFKEAETSFDTFLVEKLHEANLTKGCDTAEDAEKLLFHYRNLSSLLVPARTMVTLTYDATAGVFQRETQYPVTEKTPEQLTALDALRDINPEPLKADKTSHTVRTAAAQEADSLFVDLMIDRDRALPAQARKTHLIGAKNAFIVKNELIFSAPDAVRDDTEVNHTLWLARSGVPVYVGKGETEDSLQTHTRANLEQIRMAARARIPEAAADLHLHVTSLNTVSPFEHQDTMVRHLYRATRGRDGDDISYMPTNLDGTFRFLDIAPRLYGAGETAPSGSSPLQRADRVGKVSEVMIRASEKPNTLSVVQCASGQDRTGTAVEKATQRWMERCYGDRPTDNIQVMRAAGGNAAEIATHHLPGSPGMKRASIADDTFGPRTTFDDMPTAEFYRKSANTNKGNPVSDVSFLKTPRAMALAEYKANLGNFKAALKGYETGTGARADFYKQGKDLLKCIDAITDGDPASVDATTLAELNAVLFHGALVMTSREPEAVAKNAKILAGLGEAASKKTNRRELGEKIMMFACAALIVAGIFLIVPTGGLSMVATAIGAIGLTSLAFKEPKKELGHTVKNFKTALDDLERPAPSTTESPHAATAIGEAARLLRESDGDSDDAANLGKGRS